MARSASGAAARSRASAAAPRRWSRPIRTRAAPWRASASAASRPMPEVAPVMTTVLPITRGRARSAADLEVVHAEEIRRVGPTRRRAEAGGASEIAALGDRVFIGIFGMDALAFGEVEAAAGDGHF